jgi:hypothetical protein
MSVKVTKQNVEVKKTYVIVVKWIVYCDVAFKCNCHGHVNRASDGGLEDDNGTFKLDNKKFYSEFQGFRS